MRAPTFLLLLSLGILISGCGHRNSSGDEDEGGPQPATTVPVKVGELRQGDMRLTVEVTGTVDALRKEKVYAPIAGRLVEFKVFEGSSVTPGQVVAEIQTRESQAAVAGAEAYLKSAKTQAQRDEAQRMLNLARSGETILPVRAHIGGMIASRAVAEGEQVAENVELCSVVDPTSLYFHADVPTRSLAEIRTGQFASVRLSALPSGGLLASTIAAVSPVSDSASQTIPTRMTFNALPGSVRTLLKAGMMGTAEIVVGTHRNVLLSPRAALLRNDEKDTYSLFTVGVDSIAHEVAVAVVAVSDSLAEVRGTGLQAGMRVITEGNYALPDSTRVAVEGE